MKKCIFCGSSHLYTKSATQVKCVTCKRSWSKAKYERECTLIDAFLANQTALECSKIHALNYITVKHMYHKMRLLLATYAQEIYSQQTQTFHEYDEFYYLPFVKKKSSHHMLDAVGIFGMLYPKEWVYTLLLPDQFTPLKRLMEHEETDPDTQSYVRYLQHHKVTYVTRFEHRLGEFWNYFEAFMRPFKGVKKENLIYYLKEAEFKFNYSKKEQKEILMQLWKTHLYM